ncbi:MAG: bacillithiol biosynthesis cysteine-adding enzyme BshC [Crocinitomicaceae bacterium]
MKVFHLPKKEISAFNSQQLLLSDEQHKLSKYLGNLNDLSAFENQLLLKKSQFTDQQRLDLHQVLVRDYQEKQLPKAKASIELLTKPTTFTVTTGHQLCLFSGPSYFIYKILHTIQLARKLKETYPNYDFVPVYWMVSEDHDVEEIRSLNLFNQTIQWTTCVEGAVGDLPIEGLHEAAEKLIYLFRAETESEIKDIIQFKNHKKYADFVFDFVTELFHEFELLVLNAQDSSLKKQFIQIAEKELETQFSFNAINETNKALQEDGFNQQIHPREINLFHLSDGKRQRIIPKNNGFNIGDKFYTLEELIFEFNEKPENCSPNVVLRPVYQELILPNIAYVGGAGELSYWMQLKLVFQGCNVTFPILQMRKSFQVIDQKTTVKWNELGFTISDFFKPSDQLIRMYTEQKMKEEVSFQPVRETFSKMQEELVKIGKAAEKDLEKWIASELVKIEKQVLQIEQKLKRSVKQKHEDQLKWIEKQKERLFPNGNLQERELNFFHFCADGKIYEKLQLFLNELDPFDPTVVVLVN